MKLSFVGDISLHGLEDTNVKIDEGIQLIFNNSDFVIGNLENPITEIIDSKSDSIVHLRTSRKAINFIKNFDIVNLCNNHIFDYGFQGYKDTINLLRENNVRYFGAGENIKSAQEPFKVLLQTKKMSFISGTRWSNATNSDPGTSSYYKHKKTIEELKREGYFIVYYPHWGYEYIKIPPPDIRKHAKKMIDYGVDLIVGTHPHILQGHESYKGKHIFYSLGNYIFKNEIIENLAHPKKYMDCRTSVILEISLEDFENYEITINPIEFNDKGINLIKDNRKIDLMKEIDNYSDIFKKSYFSYLKKYYAQVPDLIEYESRLKNKFKVTTTKSSLLKKLLLFRKSSIQGILNRVAYRIFYGKK